MNDNVTRYPLAWPDGWKRTPAHQRRPSQFQRHEPIFNDEGTRVKVKGRALTFVEACDRLEKEVERLGAARPMISSNVEVGVMGRPLASSGQRRHDDPGVALYFTLKGQARCLACDAYATVAGNIAAIAAHIDALRRIDRYGIGSLDQAFAGYAPRLQSSTEEWWLVLNVPRSSTVSQVQQAYLRMAHDAHPDAGGSEHQMMRLNAARDAALRELAA